MSSEVGKTYTFKVVLLGEGAVGKTSLVLRYVQDNFKVKHESTLQASFLNKKIILESNRVNLNLWDTAGQEKFHALGPIYYRNSNSAILVYDLTDEDSFQKVKNWVKELKKILGNEIVIAIVGNKIDLVKDRNVPLEIAESYAKEVGAKHYETSAKLNEGVEELFLDLSQDMINAENIKQERTNTLQRQSSTRHRRTLVVEENDDNVERRGSAVSRCCGGS